MWEYHLMLQETEGSFGAPPYLTSQVSLTENGCSQVVDLMWHALNSCGKETAGNNV